MTLLDRFRTQARQKHADPAVRLAYVAELPLDERDLIVAAAREDADPRVRRAAVAKLMDPAALASIAQEDADEEVRAQAVTMLRDIALDAFEGVSEAESLAAVDALTDVRTLAQIAKTSLREEIGRRALSRISDTHVLGSIARHAALEAVRLNALEAVSDRADLLAIAMNSEFKDTGVAAVERLPERDDLEQIAARARNRNAAKRARAILRERDERAAEEAAAAAEAARDLEPEPAIPTETAVSVPFVEAVAPVPEPNIEAERASEEAARLREEQEAAITARAEEAQRQARELAEREAERRRARLAEVAAESEAAAAEPDLTSARRRFGVARREWKDLAAGIEVDSAVVTRFTDAEARLAAREAAAHDAEARARREALHRLHQLMARVEPLAAKPDLSLKAGDRALRDVRTALAAIPPLPSRKDYEEVVQRLKAAQAALTPKVQELREVTDWQRWANVGIQEQLCEKMEALRAIDDPEEVARRIRDLQQQWKQAADVPRAQGEALWRRFKAVHDELWIRCEAHFASQAHARAENLAKKTALCERAEALAESTHWVQTAEEIKRLQADWKTIGPVTRGQEKAIWERFRAACDRFFTRRQDDLAKRKAMWSTNLAKKEALCVRAEALAESTDWEQAAAEIRRLQAEWKTIGPVKKNRSEAIWQRFRGACDRFFNRYAARHDTARAERVAAREAIIAELEALAPSPLAIDTTAAAQSSPAGQPIETTSTPEGAAPETATAAATRESTETTGAAPADLVANVRSLRVRWQQEIAARGVDRDRAVMLDERFARAFQRVLARWPASFAGTELDASSNRKRMEALVKRMEDLAASLATAGAAADASLSPTTRLAAMLKEALAANTIGGKIDTESRWRAAQEEVRQAQASWSRIGPVADETRKVLTDRFQRACRQIVDKAAANRLEKPAPRPESRSSADRQQSRPAERQESRKVERREGSAEGSPVER